MNDFGAEMPRTNPADMLGRFYQAASQARAAQKSFKSLHSSQDPASPGLSGSQAFVQVPGVSEQLISERSAKAKAAVTNALTASPPCEPVAQGDVDVGRQEILKNRVVLQLNKTLAVGQLAAKQGSPDLSNAKSHQSFSREQRPALSYTSSDYFWNVPNLQKLPYKAAMPHQVYSHQGTRPVSSAASPESVRGAAGLNIRDETMEAKSNMRLLIDEKVFGVFKAPLRDRLCASNS